MIQKLRVRPYRVEWAEPAGDAQRRFVHREGLVLELTDEAGRVGRGEASPLPGRAEATLAECRAALLALRPEALPFDFLAARTVVSPEFTAACHALEGALAELEALRLGVPMWQVFARACQRSSVVALDAAALVDRQELDVALALAQRAAASGYGTLKLKIGREPLEHIVTRVRAIEAALPGVRLRLDANRTLSPGEARALARALAGSAVEFLEEPSPGVGARDLALPLALDESVAERGFEAACADADVLVLKPMVLGLGRCIEIARAAHAKKLIVSHCFDGPHAMAAARALALALGPGRPADGLGEHAALDAWRTRAPAWLTGPRIEPWSAPGSGLDFESER